MKIIPNPILGFFYSLSSFKLNNDGLYKKVRGLNNEHHLLFLTNDPKKILEVFDIDYDLIINTDDQDIINKLICSSPYTNINKILKLKNDKCISFQNFKEWIENNPNYIIGGQLRTERVSEVLNINIEEKINAIQNIINNYIDNKRIKMIGYRFINSLPNYNKNNFNEDFTGFIKSKSFIDHMYMVVNYTFEEILKEFKIFIKYNCIG